MSNKEVEKLSDLLQKWFENQKQGTNNNNGPLVRPDIDVTNLTWLLKEIGFNLDYLNFEAQQLGPSRESSVNIEIKCNVSGMVARLSYNSNLCACPSKKEESSFWEVQTSSPATTNVKKEASSSLLPEVSEKCSLLSKAILANLLNYYKESIGTGEKKVITTPIGRIKIPEKFNSPPVSGTPTENKVIEFPEPHVDEQNNEASLPQITITNGSLLYNAHFNGDGFKTDAEIQEKNGVPQHNITQDIVKPTRDVEQQNEVIEDQCNDSLPDASITSIHIDADNLVTSSPKKIRNTPNIRDNKVVQALNDARSKIDQALLFMNFNITQDISLTSSHLLTNTPDLKRRSVGTPMSALASKGGSVKRSATINQITGHQAVVDKIKQIQKTKLVRSNTYSLKSGTNTPLMGTSALKRNSSLHADTPRPKPSPRTQATTSQTAIGKKLTKIPTNLSASSSSVSSTNSVASSSSSKMKELPGTKKNFDIKRPSLIERFHKQYPTAPKKP